MAKTLTTEERELGKAEEVVTATDIVGTRSQATERPANTSVVPRLQFPLP